MRLVLCALTLCASTAAVGATPPTEILNPLTAGQLPEAATAAARVLVREPANAEAHALLAMVRFISLGQHLAADLRKPARFDDAKYLHDVLTLVDGQLTLIDGDLAAASTPDFALEICPACWRVDWYGDGEYSPRDQQALEVKKDAGGKPLPAHDARRRPTFRLDVGDVWLLRGLTSWQHAILKIVLAYDYVDFEQRLRHPRFGEQRLILRDGKSMKDAQALLLVGIDQLEHARTAYLAETDDDRELLPNPRQRNHPLPFHPDALVYAVWANVDAALVKLLRGQEGVPLADWARVLAPKSKEVVSGFLDVSRLFTAPHDLVFSLGGLKRHPAAAFAKLFGDSIVPSLPPSPIVTLFLQTALSKKKKR